MPIQQILELLIYALVDETDSVRITASIQPTQTVFRVEVAPKDVGKLIGKQGRIARALRTILSGCSMKDDHRYILDIVEVL